MNKKYILGVGITDTTQKEILEYIIKNVENFQKKLFLVTPNPEFLVLANKNTDFRKILNKADLASADGIGIMIAAKILGKPLKERFTGVDLVKSLCREVAKKPITVGFLGGRDGVAEKTAECLREECPGLKVGFVGERWLKGSFDARQPRISNDDQLQNPEKQQLSSVPLSKSRLQPDHQPTFSSSEKGSSHYDGSAVDILFVAFGAPKQEFWINENLGKIPVKIAIGVGGAFDYISGGIPRASFFIRQLGFEWLFRLMIQPWRWKRQLALLEFIRLIIKQKITKSK